VTCPEYSSLNATAKLARLWAKAQIAAYDPATYTMVWPSVAGTAEYSMDTTFGELFVPSRAWP